MAHKREMKTVRIPADLQRWADALTRFGEDEGQGGYLRRRKRYAWRLRILAHDDRIHGRWDHVNGCYLDTSAGTGDVELSAAKVIEAALKIGLEVLEGRARCGRCRYPEGTDVGPHTCELRRPDAPDRPGDAITLTST